MPCDQSFINSPKTSGKVKIAFFKKWIATTEKFIEDSKTMHLPFCKVVAMICEQDFWGSEIIIFYDKNYYDTFFNRNDKYQTWTQVDNRSSFIKRRGINTSLTEVCLSEELVDEDDEDYVYNSFMWFYKE